jgi:hypothetical protein
MQRASTPFGLGLLYCRDFLNPCQENVFGTFDGRRSYYKVCAIRGQRWQKYLSQAEFEPRIPYFERPMVIGLLSTWLLESAAIVMIGRGPRKAVRLTKDEITDS